MKKSVDGQMKQEIWKEIDGTDGFYQISNLGNVRSEHYLRTGTWKKRHGVVKGTVNGGGYLFVKMYVPGKHSRTRAVHQLVADAFLGVCPTGKEVNHIDSDKQNNKVENLEYLTRDEHIHHAMKAGERWVPKGEACSQTILTVKQIRDMRTMAALCKKKYGLHARLSKIYGVGRSTISAVLTRKTWKWLN